MEESQKLQGKLWFKMPDDLHEMSDKQISQVAQSLWLKFMSWNGESYE
jgi:hypothetical protein